MKNGAEGTVSCACSMGYFWAFISQISRSIISNMRPPTTFDVGFVLASAEDGTVFFVYGLNFIYLLPTLTNNEIIVIHSHHGVAAASLGPRI